MKLLVRLSLLLTVLVLPAPALSAQLSIASYTGNAGSNVLAAISYSAQGTPVSTMQLDLEYDSSQMSIVSVIGDGGRDVQKLIYSRDLEPNKKRILVGGINQTLLQDGVLVSVFVNLKQTATVGTLALKMSQVVCSDPYGRLVPVTTVDGSVLVAPGSADAAPIQQDGVLNAATLRTGPIAPGELITLIGSSIGPADPAQPQATAIGTMLGGTRLLVNGIPSPLLYVSSNQINAVVPYGISGASANLIVEIQGQKRAGVTLPVAAASPALFTADSTGVGLADILNQDGSVNTPSNPAPRGSTVSVFATGAGQMDPPAMDAQIGSAMALARPVLPVSIQIGGIAVDPSYAGTAPGTVSGVIQVNFPIPDGVIPGFPVSLSIQIGSLRSPAGVTIAVKQDEP